MWQLDSEATSASSGSTAAATDMGSGTTCGDAEAGTSIPPSNSQRWPREKRASVNVALPRCQTIVDRYSAMVPPDDNSSTNQGHFCCGKRDTSVSCAA